MAFWSARTWLSYLLLPFAALFWLISRLRRFAYQRGWLSVYRAPLPVIVVGNLSVGGNGKTPFSVWLVAQLQQRGYRVGIISRGYGANTKDFPLLVTADSDPVLAGDEPVLLAMRTGVPVCISPNRRQSIECLLQHFPLDLIISDDGLQHYALARDLEIVVVDAKSGWGNAFLLPAGPLRELPSRLNSVDFVVANGAARADADAVMRLEAAYAVNLLSGQRKPLREFGQANAIAGIGRPERFFDMLVQEFGIDLVERCAFRDHQAYNARSFEKLSQNRPLFMTEKDAVKCRAFARENWWYVPVETFVKGDCARLFEQIENLKASKNES